MKFIITEEQNLKLDTNKFKQLMFKYWDKFGGKVDDQMILSLGLRGFINSGRLYWYELYEWLIDWRGELESQKYCKELLSGSHNVNEFEPFGGYDFNFVFENFEWFDSTEVRYLGVYCIVDDIKGEVELTMVGGETVNLEDALLNEEYGWEIKNEVEDGVSEWLNEIKKMTGYEFAVQIKFKSSL
jgi:hypothetical protein